jgi:predicted regulator of Ras-like GTPase activity (Roadblock/LC7/MglB family)
VVKKINKTLEAENITLLKHLLTIELRRLCEENNIDMAMFMGIDGRTFSSHIPQQLTTVQFHLLNLIKSNIKHICGQLQSENMKVSIQQFKEGTIIISGVGDNAFLVSIIGKNVDVSQIRATIDTVLVASAVLLHILEVKPINDEVLADYPPAVSAELRKLSRLLFKEQFEQTREYKKNIEILNFLKDKIQSVVGVGAVDEIVTMVFNELGTAPAYMKANQWRMFIDKVIRERITEMRGDIVADECLKTWVPEMEKKLKSFV